MPTTEHYRKLISEIPFGVERKVFQTLCLHVGEENAISLRDLAVLTFGHPTEYRLLHGERVYNFDDIERKTRKVIETLRREYRIPVMSNSGKAWKPGGITCWPWPTNYAKREYRQLIRGVMTQNPSPRTRCSMSIFATLEFYVRAFFLRRDMRRLEELRRRLFDV